MHHLPSQPVGSAPQPWFPLQHAKGCRRILGHAGPGNQSMSICLTRSREPGRMTWPNSHTSSASGFAAPDPLAGGIPGSVEGRTLRGETLVGRTAMVFRPSPRKRSAADSKNDSHLTIFLRKLPDEVSRFFHFSFRVVAPDWTVGRHLPLCRTDRFSGS